MRRIRTAALWLLFAGMAVLIGDLQANRPILLSAFGWNLAAAYPFVVSGWAPIVVGLGMAVLSFGLGFIPVLRLAGDSQRELDGAFWPQLIIVGWVSLLFGIGIGIVYRLEVLRIEETGFGEYRLLVQGLVSASTCVVVVATMLILLAWKTPGLLRSRRIAKLTREGRPALEIIQAVEEANGDIQTYLSAIYTAQQAEAASLLPLIQAFYQKFPDRRDRYSLPAIEGAALLDRGDLDAAERRLTAAFESRGDILVVVCLADLHARRGRPERAALWARYAQRLCDNSELQSRLQYQWIKNGSVIDRLRDRLAGKAKSNTRR